MTQLPKATPLTMDSTAADRLKATRRELTVGDVMSMNVITATADSTIFHAARTMSENRVSCLVVVDDAGVTGILTEKDVLKGVARDDVEFRRLKVADRMSSVVETVPVDMSVIQAGRTMETRHIKRLPVVNEGQLLGLVTQTDIMRGLVALSPLRAVSDIMNSKVATVQANATVAEAARVMASKDISCVVALHRHDVAGILTEKDLLKRVVALHKNPAETRVSDVMSFPITVVPPMYSVLSATQKMDNMHLHRLIVMDDNQVCGIVTQTDLMRAIRGELDRLEAERRMLAAELVSLMGYVKQDPARLQQVLAPWADSSGSEAAGSATIPPAVEGSGNIDSDTGHLA
jgi:CBS domain-containing protein